jgi:hypothetical protein
MTKEVNANINAPTIAAKTTSFKFMGVNFLLMYKKLNIKKKFHGQ